MDADMWCDFCNDKVINTTVKVRGRNYGVCSHCASLTVQDRPEVESDKE